MITPKAITPKCDFCDREAVYDGKTMYGPWAYMCEEHKNFVGVKGKAAELLIHRLKKEEVSKKRCSVCGEEKPLNAFYQYVDHSGTVRYRSECKVCNLQRKQLNYNKRREKDHD